MLPEDEITDLDQLPQSLPGHSISLTPEIKLDDEIILTAPATVDAFTMETTLAFEVQQLVGETKWVDGPLTRAVREGASAISTKWSRRARTSRSCCTR